MITALRKISVRLLLLLIGTIPIASAHGLPLEKLWLPAGFSISVFAELANPRQLAMSPEGVIFAGSRRKGRVYAIVDRDGDFIADEVITIDKGLKLPSGIAYKDGDLYVGAVNRLLVYKDIVANLDSPPEPQVIDDSLPKKSHHGWKHLGFGPDGWLYLNVGAPCNICLSDDERFASILRVDLSSSPLRYQVYAAGVRNSVGFDWHPETGELWFTDNGRDYLGDNAPPCELNHAPEPGIHFGYPFFHGNGIPDPKFGKDKNERDFAAPALALGPHVAPLGMLFYRGDMLPSSYKHQVLIAEHGSWNRSGEAGHVGYRITLARKTGDDQLRYETLIDGWLDGKSSWGRPVDLLELPDGSLLISDDSGNVIYRLTYEGV